MVCSAAINLAAQEYMYELGAELGVSYYSGDATRKSFLAPKDLAFGITGRYNVNFRWVLTAGLNYRGLRGDTMYADNVFPMGQTAAFRTNTASIHVGGEFNWYALSDRYRYLGTRSWSPYVGGGIVLLGGWGSMQRVLTPGVYAALGVKYKLNSRLSATAQWLWQYHLSDRLDALGRSSFLANPYGMNIASLKGGDALGAITLGLSYHLGRRNKGNCND